MTAANEGSGGATWYHTLDLPSGPTPGEYDLRSTVAKLPFPPSLAGRRCLDVGTHDLLVSAAIAVGPSIVYRSVPVARISTQVGQPFWTTPNIAGLRRQVESAGFEVVRQGPVHRQPRGAGAPRAERSGGWRSWRALPGDVLHRRGVPHLGLLARPVRSAADPPA